MKNILHFVFPGGVLFAGCSAILYSHAWARVESAHIDVAGLIIFVFAAFLGWRFDRNRLIYALVLLLVADLADRWFITNTSYVTLHQVVSILVPFNFFLLALMRERGVRSLYSFSQLMLIPGQAVLVYFWMTKWDSKHQGILAVSHLPEPLDAVPDVWLAVVGLALAVQLVRYLNVQNPVETAFLWAILCAATASVMPPGVEPTLFRVFSVLIIAVSVLEMSYALAYRDELTSLPGRRALNETFRKLSGQYVLAMADIDHFKKLNDSYGHDVGDQVLKMVAARLARCTGGGQAYRYGGEEFCLVFKGKMPESVVPHLEKLRASVADEPFIIRQKVRPVKKPKKPRQNAKTRKNIKVTISVGVAGKNNDRKNPEDVLKSADQALYRAKKSGRNRVNKQA